MTIVYVGIDLAKNVFAVHGVDDAGRPALVRQEPAGQGDDPRWTGPMKWTSIVSIYTLFWVLSCFLVMPFGIRTHADVAGTAEEVERVSGQVDSAPINFNPRRTALRAALLALVLFARRMPEMIVPYADAAALMLQNLSPGGPMARQRVGLALPVGMKGHKAQWAAKPGQ